MRRASPPTRPRTAPLRLSAALLLAAVLLVAGSSPARAGSPGDQAREELTAELALQIDEALSARSARFELDESSLQLRGELPEMWRLELLEPSSWRTRRVQAQIFDVASPQRPVAFVQSAIEITIPVLTAARSIEPNEALKPGLFRSSYVSIYRAPHDAVGRLEELDEKVLMRRLGEGKILSAAALDDPIVIERGEAVTLRVRRGSVELLDSGVALEAGKLNHPVRVRSNSTDAVVTGTAQRDGVSL